MKKTYMTPVVNVEKAQPTSLLCESFGSNVGIGNGGGSNGNAHTKEEEAWDIWGEE